MQASSSYRVRAVATAIALFSSLACQSTSQSFLPDSPCRDNNGGCDANATCSATVFATEATCTCREGFIGDGHSCKPCSAGFTAKKNKCVDDCQTDNGGCDVHATCGHDGNGVTCTCSSGWSGDGKTCADTQLCEKTSGLCGVGTCVDGVGTYSCQCPAGFVAQGGTCIDGCTISNGGCDSAHVCEHAEDTSIVCLPKYSVLSVGPNGADRDTSGALYGQTCGIRTDGTLWCWGRNDLHQIDNTAVANVSSPRQKGSDNDWVAVSVGPADMCALKSNHSIWCTSDGLGKLWQVGTQTDWTAVVAGSLRDCGIRAGQIFCWDNDLHTGGVSAPSFGTPARIGTDNDWVSLTMDDKVLGHLCALKTDRSLWCWGPNGSGQVGDGGLTDSTSPRHIGGRQWLSVSAGRLHTCAIDDGHRLWCWGSASDFALGIGASPTETKVAIPTRVGTDEDWLAVGAGRDHTCAVKQNGTLWCWGREWRGALGDAGLPQQLVGDDSGVFRVLPGSATPQQVGTGTNWAGLSVGSGTTCALRREGAAWCWGNNATGQLGHGRNGRDPVAEPIAVAPQVMFTSLSVRGQTVCGIDSQGQVWCWGQNESGQFGNGTQVSHPVPLLVSTPSPWSSLVLSHLSACAIATDGALWCWGRTGLTTTTDYGAVAKGSVTPQEFGSAGHWASVGSGDGSLCAIATGGLVTCWTLEDAKQDEPFLDGKEPYVVGTTWTAVSGDGDSTCGLATDGLLLCWGSNAFGVLGTGNTTPSGVPVTIDESHTFSAFTVGQESACAIRSDDQSLWCWGSQAHGALGNAKTDPAPAAPTQVSVAGTWSAVSCDGADCCALKTTGEVWCWGQLSGTNEPVQAASGTDWASIHRGRGFQCGLKTGGKAFCWGDDSGGQLGDSGPFSNVPVYVLP